MNHAVLSLFPGPSKTAHTSFYIGTFLKEVTSSALVTGAQRGLICLDSIGVALIQALGLWQTGRARHQKVGMLRAGISNKYFFSWGGEKNKIVYSI